MGRLFRIGLFATALVFALALPVRADITAPQAVVTASGTIYATDGIETINLGGATTAGDLIIAVAGASSSSRTLTVTDNRGGGSHTYNQAATTEEGGAFEVWVYYTVTDAAVSSVTFTLNSALASPGWAAVIVLRASNGWDATIVGDFQDASIPSQGSPANTGSTGFTTTATSSVVVGVFQPVANETWNDPVAVDSDTVNCTNVLRYSDGAGFAGAVAYQILSNTEADYSFNFGWSSGNATGRTVIVEMQEAEGAEAETPRRLLLMGVGGQS